ncbi:hypothetical protein IV38_GL001105 [Lactobacillus selangorensis]|uniref:Uncharacterized protein n=1 Tax=Lactobacillus selangorensis TaxID=81857 RepID=A0A0R2FJT6_9LACO|nr:hypothetical protein IV38_GL001105 [Lactobacillus selangorensis]
MVAHVMGEKIKAWNGQHAGDFAKKLQQAEQTIQTNTAQLTNDTDAAAVREAGSFIAEFAAVCAAHSQAVVCTEN